MDNDGAILYLQKQVDKIYRNTNEKGFETRARYRDAAHRFCAFLASEYKMQKFQNVKGKHFVAYVEKMINEGKSASTIKTDMSGIRFMYERGGGKYRLPSNEKITEKTGLQLPSRKTQSEEEDKAWLNQERKGALALAGSRNSRRGADGEMISLSIKLASQFGTRLNEAIVIPLNGVKGALKYGVLRLDKGTKGGLPRVVPVITEEQRATLRELVAFAHKHKLTGGDKILAASNRGDVKKTKVQIQNWMTNNRHHFMDNSPEHRKATAEAHAEMRARGQKPPKDTITYHGLRHTYCQTRIKQLERTGQYTEREINKKVSEELGHDRASVTRIYMAYFK